MQITLYYAPLTCALVPYVTLLEAKCDFEVKVVNFLKGEHLSPEYVAINPKHKVPALDVDGQVLTENLAILQWIDTKAPGLLPPGLERFRAISLMSWCASGIHPTLTPNALPNRYCDIPGSEGAVKSCAQKLTREQFAIAENLLAERDWFLDGFSIPDVYFYWCYRRAKQFGIELTEFKRCEAHFDRMGSRPSVEQVLKFESEVVAEWQNKT